MHQSEHGQIFYVFEFLNYAKKVTISRLPVLLILCLNFNLNILTNFGFANEMDISLNYS